MSFLEGLKSFISPVVSLFTGGWSSAVALVASIVIQQNEASRIRDAQRRAQEDAAAAADAAKGFQMVVSGSPAALPIVYGRALVGGSRVFQQTFSNYKFANPAASGTAFTSNILREPPTVPAGKRKIYFVGPPNALITLESYTTVGASSFPTIIQTFVSGARAGDPATDTGGNVHPGSGSNFATKGAIA